MDTVNDVSKLFKEDCGSPYGRVRRVIQSTSSFVVNLAAALSEIEEFLRKARNHDLVRSFSSGAIAGEIVQKFRRFNYSSLIRQLKSGF